MKPPEFDKLHPPAHLFGHMLGRFLACLPDDAVLTIQDSEGSPVEFYSLTCGNGTTEDGRSELIMKVHVHPNPKQLVIPETYRVKGGEARCV